MLGFIKRYLNKNKNKNKTKINTMELPEIGDLYTEITPRASDWVLEVSTLISDTEKRITNIREDGTAVKYIFTRIGDRYIKDSDEYEMNTSYLLSSHKKVSSNG